MVGHLAGSVPEGGFVGFCFFLLNSSVASFCKATCCAHMCASWPGARARTRQGPFLGWEDATSAAVSQQTQECSFQSAAGAVQVCAGPGNPPSLAPGLLSFLPSSSVPPSDAEPGEPV